MDLHKLVNAAGMINYLDHGAASHVSSEGCHGVTQEHLELFAELVRAEECERLTAEVAQLRLLTFCGCGDQFSAHDPGTCGACVAGMTSPIGAPIAPDPQGVGKKPFFTFDAENGVEFHATQHEAIVYAEEALRDYRASAKFDGEWSGDVEAIQVGIVTHRAIAIDSGDGCDYLLSAAIDQAMKGTP